MIIVKMRKYTTDCRGAVELETKMALFLADYLCKTKTLKTEEQVGWIKKKKTQHNKGTDIEK